MRVKRIIRIIITSLIAVIIVAGMALGMLTLQTTVQLRQIRSESDEELARIELKINDIDQKIVENVASYDDIFISRAKTLAYLIGNEVDEIPDGKTIESYRKLLKVDMCAIIDRKGKTTLRAGNTGADFTARRFKELRSLSSESPAANPFSVDFGNMEQRFYSHLIDDDRIAVVGIDTGELNELKSYMASWAYKLESMSTSYGGYGFAISDKNYKMLYYPEEELIGQNALKLGVRPENLKDGYFGIMILNGELIYGNVKDLGDTYVICAVKNDSITDAIVLSTSIIMACTILIVLIVALYRRFLNKKNINHKTINRKCFIASSIGLLVITLLSLYVQTLFAITRQSLSFDNYSMSIDRSVSEAEEDIEVITNRYNDSYLSKAEVASYIVKTKPEVKTHDELLKLSDALGINHIYVFDKEGKVEATDSGYTNFVISNDPNEQSYEFRKLLNGVDYVIQEAMPNEVAGEFCQYVGVCIRGDDGLIEGAIQIEVRPELLEKTIDSYTIESILSNVRTAHGGSTIAIDKETGIIVYHPDSYYIGKDIKEFADIFDRLREGFRDFISINNIGYYAECIETDNEYILSLVPNSVLYKDRGIAVLIDFIVAFVSFALLLGLYAFLGKKLRQSRPPKQEVQSGDQYMTRIGDRYIQTKPSISRTSIFSPGWDAMTADQQIVEVINYVMTFFAACLVIALVFKDSLFENSILGYILEGNWNKGFNIFAITSSIMMVLIISVAQSIIRDILKIIARDLDARGETVCRLMISVTKYIALIIMVYYTLSTLGVDTSALVASMGILSLVIGLGANKLISDVLAGLFIIMEGEFRVGDTVNVGDFEGVVQDIGIRTTKILNDDQNIKIVNNSDINGVVNMTRQYSLAKTLITIEYKESLERVENVLERELPLVGQKYDRIIQGPFYKGVYEMNQDGVVLLILTLCEEEERLYLQYDLNREIKLICDRNGINIPVSQVVIEEAPSFERASEWQKYKADKFARSQSQILQNLQDDMTDDGIINQSNQADD